MEITSSFQKIEWVHSQLEWLIRQHQLFILRHDPLQASSYLERFEKAVRLHMSEEESHLFPLLEVHGDVDQIGTVQTLANEHTKIRAALGIIQSFYNRWTLTKEPGLEALALLEEELRLKDLLHQHHLREQLLMPDLDRVINEEERKKVLDRFTPVNAAPQ